MVNNWDSWNLYSDQDYLEHHSILGQKWGIRRYQNPDDTLTDLGKKMAADRAANNNRNFKTGEARINRRLNKYEKGIDKNLASASRKTQFSTIDNATFQKENMDLLTDPKRLNDFGKQTRINRATALASGAAASGAFAVAGAIAEVGAIPMIGIPAAAIATGTYIIKALS